MIHNIPITTGELLDKITILKLKVAISSTQNNMNQLTALMLLWADVPIEERIKIDQLIYRLFETNKEIWNLEDKVRSTKDDSELLECAKLIFKKNQERNYIKKDIDKAMKSDYYEEKVYH